MIRDVLEALLAVAAAAVVVGIVAVVALIAVFAASAPVEPEHDSLETPYDAAPSWSPDGRRIAYLRYDDETAAVHVVDVGTGERHELGEGSDFHPELRWSPDGRRLAFVSDRDGEPLHPCPDFTDCESWTTAELYVADVVTGELTRLSRNGVDEVSPAWSPDGRRIAFLSGRDRLPGEAYRRDVYVLDLATRRVRRLTADRLDQEELEWRAPQTLTYRDYEGNEYRLTLDGRSTLVGRARDAGGWNEQEVSSAGAAARTTDRDRNGQSCSFDSEWQCHPNRELYLRPAGGGRERRITRTTKDEYDLAWSPDGRALAFASGERLWLVDADGRGLRQLTR